MEKTVLINAKVEGSQEVLKALDQNVQYHIGGFRNNENTVRKIMLNFAAGDVIKTSTGMELHIKADINKWFSSIHQLKIADSAITMTPGSLAMKFADNYATMFSIMPPK